ncbi:MAG: zinc-dependent alcohol dehydrogenase, partial [Phyllobacterium sp.]
MRLPFWPALPRLGKTTRIDAVRFRFQDSRDLGYCSSQAGSSHFADTNMHRTGIAEPSVQPVSNRHVSSLELMEITMKAVAKLRPENGAMSLIDLDRPVPKPGEALIKITAGGICGTDVAIWKWHESVVGQYAPTFPLVVGHEFAGTVMSASPACRAVMGDTVAVNPQIACRQCEYCMLGRPTLCVDRRLMGGRIDGGWTEYVTVPEQNIYPLPKGVDSAVAPLLEPLSVATHAVLERVQVRPGDVVVVIGAGPIGLLVAILAKTAGASNVVITGIGADAGRLELARKLGAIPINVEESEPIGVVKALQWDGADIVYETSGNASVFDQAVGLSRRTGRIG